MSKAPFEALLSQARPDKAPIIAVGNFDGVHLGHRAILHELVRRAEAVGTVARVLTFEPHPVTSFGKYSPEAFRLTSPEQKSDILAGLGVGPPIVLPFVPDLYQMSPEVFARTILCEGLGAQEVWVGYDFNFGRGRVGTCDDLRRFGAKLGFKVEIHPAVHLDGAVVSSTRIRKELAAGKLEAAERCLGRKHALRGERVPGAGRGRTMGFPTVNLMPKAGLMVPHGVYVTQVRSVADPEKVLPAVTNIGVRPTVEINAAPNVESFIVGDDEIEDVVTGTVEVELLGFLRPERKFDTLEDLKRQIAKDVEAALAHHQDMLGASTSKSSGSA